MDPDQFERAFAPLNAVDAKALEEIADQLRSSRDKRKRAVGVFLSRINQCRVGASSAGAAGAGNAPTSGLKDLTD